MYCVKCGVELADSEKKCPLCGVKVICPEGVEREEASSPYPPHPGRVTEGIPRSGILFILSFLFSVPIVISVLCDLRLNRGIVWSGYVVGALLLIYVSFVLPMWWKKPNPVIFMPIGFLAAGLYLLYINLKTGGNWFISLAFPVVGIAALILTAVVTITRYTKGGELFVYGGASILFGGASILLEFLICITFDIDKMFRWSLYPFTAMLLLGMMFIIIGICKPLRESLRKKLFF